MRENRRMKNSSYYIAPVGVQTHDLQHTLASNMGKVSYALTHSATAAVNIKCLCLVSYVNDHKQTVSVEALHFRHVILLQRIDCTMRPVVFSSGATTD